MKKSKTHWDDFKVQTFITICLEEATLGNKPTSSLNKVGYDNLVKKFKERTSYDYTHIQHKNHWDSLKIRLAKLENPRTTNRNGLVQCEEDVQDDF